jgi:hypothetical protein
MSKTSRFVALLLLSARVDDECETGVRMRSDTAYESTVIDFATSTGNKGSSAFQHIKSVRQAQS